MSLISVVKEITSIRKFFETRGSDSDPTALQQSFADSIIHKIGLMKDFGAMDAAKINEALSDEPVGPQTARIRAHVEELVSKSLKKSMQAPSTAATKAQTPKSNQFLKYWWRYLTETELAFLSEQSKSFNGKMALLVERAMKIGCHSGDEQTKKWMMALLVRLHYTELPSAQTLYDKIQDLKRACQSEFKMLYAEFLDEYPEQAEELPKAIFTAAYADEAPHPIELSGINAIAEAIPLRKNSKLLKKHKTPMAERLDAEKALRDSAKTDDHNFRAGTAADASVKAEPLVKAEPREVKMEVCSSDEDEAVIRAAYELKIARIRAKREMPTSPSASGSAVSVSRTADGGFCLSTKAKTESSSPIKQEDVKPETEVKHEAEKPSAAATAETPSLEDLDPYTQAALNSLRKRNVVKKMEAEAAKAQKTAPSEAPKTGSSNATKTGSSKAPKTGSSKAPKKTPAAAGKKRPAAAKTTVEKQVIIKHESKPAASAKPAAKRGSAAVKLECPKVKPSMPSLPKDGSNPKPVNYWGGIIYTARAAKKFRALKVKGDTYTEASASWGGDKPSKASWDKCLIAIKDHHSGK